MTARKKTKPTQEVATPSSVWDRPGEASTYRDENREYDGITFTLKRRALTFPEETRILSRVTDAKTRRPDCLEMLALTVEATVRDTNFGLTAKRVRDMLPDRPNLAWFLIRWICSDTLRNIAPDVLEDLRKKSGP